MCHLGSGSSSGLLSSRFFRRTEGGWAMLSGILAGSTIPLLPPLFNSMQEKITDVTTAAMYN